MIDNTNPSAATRAEYLSLVRGEFASLGVRVRAFVFDASFEVAKHNSIYRAVETRGKRKDEGRREALPLAAFMMYEKAFQDVKSNEGSSGFNWEQKCVLTCYVHLNNRF